MKTARQEAYRQKLLDPRWQKKRLEILNRDEFACRKCGDKESTLHVHHFWYENDKEPWEIEDGALITLCGSVDAGNRWRARGSKNRIP